ncbi:MAG: sensor histidine kinase [Gemmatimonadota bacterium]
MSTAWLIAVLAIFGFAMLAWALRRSVLRPLRQLRRDLNLTARALQESEMRLRAAAAEQQRVLGLFEAITEGILEVSENGRILHANAAARALLNLPADVGGQTARSLIRHLELRELIERAARGETVAPAEVVLDGRQLLIGTQALPLVNGKGGGAVITVVELTELRRIESVRRDFVANVSHELKTPLTSIRGYAETLLTDDMPREAQRQFLEVIHKNATRIQRIVDELLDLSRLQSGGWRPDLQEIDVGELAEDVWTAYEAAAHAKRIHFEVAGEAARVIADPDGLRQVMSNLFDNAIRYTPEGGQIKVVIRRAHDGHATPLVELEVRDSGVGIPRDALPRIFERFFRVDAARSREQGGTGLGLSIVKHLVDRMAGEVSAQSELGRGTSIRVRLPAAD